MNLSTINDVKTTIDRALQVALERQNTCPALQQAMAYGTLQGGKRFRPLLMRAVADLLRVDFVHLVPVAVAVELVHAYSLAHDDLPAMDNSPLRRGQPSCWKQFGEATAILSGDALLTLAFQILAEASYPPHVALAFVTELAKASGARGMVAGQMLDISLKNNSTIEIIQHLENLKTGQLLAFSCMAPAILAQESLETQKTLHTLGLALGLIYQVVDDLLDDSSTPEILGKPTQNDTDKITLLTLMGVEKAWHFVENQATIVQEKITYLNAPGSPHLLLDILRWMQTRNY